MKEKKKGNQDDDIIALPRVKLKNFKFQKVVM